MTKPLRVFVGKSFVGSSHAGGEEELGAGESGGVRDWPVGHKQQHARVRADG